MFRSRLTVCPARVLVAVFAYAHTGAEALKRSTGHCVAGRSTIVALCPHLQRRIDRGSSSTALLASASKAVGAQQRSRSSSDTAHRRRATHSSGPVVACHCLKSSRCWMSTRSRSATSTVLPPSRVRATSAARCSSSAQRHAQSAYETGEVRMKGLVSRPPTSGPCSCAAF